MHYRQPIYFELSQLEDYLKMLDKLIKCYEASTETGMCPVSFKQYKWYLSLKNQVLETLHNNF